MQRAYTNLDDQTLHLIDQEAVLKGITRSKWISLAIESYLNHDGAGDSTQLDNMRTSLDQQGQQIAHLKELLEMRAGEIQHLRELSSLLTSKIIPALPVSSTPLPETPKKPRWKFW
jgi:hypothetical protein